MPSAIADNTPTGKRLAALEIWKNEVDAWIVEVKATIEKITLDIEDIENRLEDGDTILARLDRVDNNVLNTMQLANKIVKDIAALMSEFKSLKK